jgi:hypothetical protein
VAGDVAVFRSWFELLRAMLTGAVVMCSFQSLEDTDRVFRWFGLTTSAITGCTFFPS